MKKHNIFTLIVMVIFLCLLLVMIVQLFPLIRDIVTDANDESSIVAQVDSFGWRGVPALIGLSALQVIIPIIPAPAVGILAGLSYGIYGGPLIFLAGVTLGNLFVVVSMRSLHNVIPRKKKANPKPSKLLSKEKLKQIKRPEVVAFLLVLIPWVSSVGPYLFAETRVSLWKYLVAVILGSIPSTITYVFLGDRISGGNYTAAIITAAIVVVVLGVVLLFRKKILAKIMDESGENK
ncbi:MAG: VTT domain-containing protein [Oscillospiraceae bacterium]|nr:VTT domain-containing protein [Oscillospiraceae bacterium]